MNINKIKLLIKERWKFYLIGYIMGYAIPIMLEGVPNWQYLFPLKIMGIAGALGIGTAYYYGSKKRPVFEILRRSVKYAVFISLLFLVTFGIKELLLISTGFDITPFIGIPRSTR